MAHILKSLLNITISLAIVLPSYAFIVPQSAPISLKCLLDRIVYTHHEALQIREYPTGEMLKEVIASPERTLDMFFYMPGDTLYITYINSNVSVWNGREVVDIKRVFHRPRGGGVTTSNIMVEKKNVASIPPYIKMFKDWRPVALEKLFRKKYEGCVFEITPVSGVLRIIILNNGEYELEQIRCFSSEPD